MSLDRLSWDQVWALTADIAAKRSLCARRQVGCVIVTADNRIASVSFNGAPDPIDCGGKPCTEWCDRAKAGATDSAYETCAANHAEQNALIRANWDMIQGGTIYTSSSTCINCAKLIAAAGITRVVHRTAPEDAHRSPANVYAYLMSMGIQVDEYEHIGIRDTAVETEAR